MSKKQVKAKNNKKHDYSKSLLVFIVMVLVVVILAAVAYYYVSTHQAPVQEKSWSLDTSGHLTFPDRGAIVANSTFISATDNYTLEKVVYNSFGDDVYASLCTPKNMTNPPVVIVLPARTITKELDLPMAENLAAMGYASLTLDERGYGETGGVEEANWSAGFDSYLAGGVPVQYKQIYDALKGLDYVKTRSDLDGNDTAILGESIGGMWSIIAAAEEPQFKGVITVSSSGFGFPTYDNVNANKFLGSIEPSNYLSLLPPRKLVMIHFTKDPIIPIGDGKALYDNASQPKVWYQYEGVTHGLPNMTYMPDMQRELQGMLGR